MELKKQRKIRKKDSDEDGVENDQEIAKGNIEPFEARINKGKLVLDFSTNGKLEYDQLSDIVRWKSKGKVP